MANINKNEIGYNENTTANALMVQYKRGLAAPMDISEVFTSLTSAQQYAKKDPIAYAGQTIAVAGEGIKTEVYKITSGGTLVRLVDENDIKNLSGGTNNITTVTPDWNAVEGEDGYIENRTHYTEKVNGELFHVTDDIYDVHYKINQSDNELDETFYLRVFYTDGANISFNKVYKSSNFHNELYNGLELGTIDTPLGRLYIFVNIDTDNTYTIVVASADGGYFDKEGIINELVVEKIYVLDEKYIPDTIARKSDIEGGSGSSPIVKGDVDNSAVLKCEYEGYSNRAISQTSMAVGAGTISGLKGYYIKYASATTIYISEVNTELLDSEPSIDNNFINPYEVGDVYSVHYGNNYYNAGTIQSIDHNKIVVDTAPTPLKDAELRYHFYVFDKANEGVVDLGKCAYAEGFENKAYNVAAHAEGYGNKSFGKYSHTEGKLNEAGYCAHAEGSTNKAYGNTSHAEGTDNRALNSNTHVEGRYTYARGYASHAEGYGESVEVSTEASGEGAHAEGRVTKAQGNYSHTEGQYTSAVGIASHAEGKGESVANPNLASGNYSHVEGEKTKATNIAAHAEGIITTSSGKAAHAEGRETQALADYSHAEGYLSSVVSGAIGGHSEGVYNIVNNPSEHASGKYNISTPKTADNTTADATHFSIGIGTSDTNRKNAVEVKQNGDVYITGIGGFDGANYDNAKSVQDTIKELTETVKNLNDIIKQITITE